MALLDLQGLARAQAPRAEEVTKEAIDLCLSDRKKGQAAQPEHLAPLSTYHNAHSIGPSPICDDTTYHAKSQSTYNN